MAHWQEVVENVYQFQDSCLVYAVKGRNGLVIINTGTGLAADHLGELEANGEITVLLTHHFRDHTDGAIRFAEVGAEILGPYWDKEYLIDPDQHFRERQIWNSYDNRWDRFSPVRPLPVSDWMMDYETRRIAGLEWEDIHFGAESQGAKLKPYQAHYPGGGTIEFDGWVINPFPAEQKARLHLIGPEGWTSDSVEVELSPREQKTIRVSITPPAGTKCRRQPVGLDLTVGDRPFGQVSEALVTIGYPIF